MSVCLLKVLCKVRCAVTLCASVEESLQLCTKFVFAGNFHKRPQCFVDNFLKFWIAFYAGQICAPSTIDVPSAEEPHCRSTHNGIPCVTVHSQSSVIKITSNLCRCQIPRNILNSFFLSSSKFDILAELAVRCTLSRTSPNGVPAASLLANFCRCSCLGHMSKFTLITGMVIVIAAEYWSYIIMHSCTDTKTIYTRKKCDKNCVYKGT